MSGGERGNLETHQGTVVVRTPPHFPTMHTRETVVNLASFGLNDNQVAYILKCTPDDVRQFYKDEMEHGLTRINAQVMSAVLHAALHSDSAADRKLWLINKAGWKAGDSNRLPLKPGEDGPLADGEYSVVERREVMTRILTRVVQEKRNAEKVVGDGRVVATVAAKPTGAKPNGTNGHGANGNGSKK